MATNENFPPTVIKQLAKELKNLDESPPEGIKVGVNDEDFSNIYADIEGPAGTPYENGVFRMKLLLSHDFPHSPPKGYFLTKIFHPNIASNGEICVNTLKKDWNPNLGLRHILLDNCAYLYGVLWGNIVAVPVTDDLPIVLHKGKRSCPKYPVVRCLLIEPFPESALNEQAGKMLLENYEEYARHARLYTGIHAKPKPKFKSGAISESTTVLNVDQTNASILNADQKTTVTGAALPQPSPLAPSITVSKGGNSHDQLSSVVPSSETGVSGSATAAAALAPMPTMTAMQKKEVGVAKLQVDKKKMDARKKSLKRL